jgi:hypothetical protein
VPKNQWVAGSFYALKTTQIFLNGAVFFDPKGGAHPSLQTLHFREGDAKSQKRF